MLASTQVDLSEPVVIQYKQKETVQALNRGEIKTIRISQRMPVDKIVAFGLGEGFLKNGLRSFPDPRKKWEVPIDALLLPQILQRLNDEHSMLLAPYMLNSAELMTGLGYNVEVLSNGFNDRAIYPRETAFHGDTLKHILLACRGATLINWYNSAWLSIWRGNSPGRTKQYILDGTKIEVPAHRVNEFQNAGVVKNKDGTISYGYKAVWIMELIDKKGVLVALNITPIQVNDIEIARPLLADFPFEEGSSVIADRGFIDGEWITKMKTERGVDFFIPMKKNMEIAQAALAVADHRQLWEPHPTRENQMIATIPKEDLFWNGCPVIEAGVLARWWRKDGKQEQVLFVTTKQNQSSKMVLATYDQRPTIEQAHLELKCFQGIETLPSTKFTQVVFRIIMGVIGYNLMNLFLNSEKCDTFEQFTIKTLRQKRAEELNPKIIIYTHNGFGILTQFEFLSQILKLKKSIQEKLAFLFENLSLNLAPS
jgi:hypothetical protein